MALAQEPGSTVPWMDMREPQTDFAALDHVTAESFRSPGLDIPMVPNGEITDSGWALARLNDGSGAQIQTFAYPETTNRVRLYLIDTAVKYTGTWFSKNAKLTFKGTTTISGKASKSFEHGTKMLSVIAGPETGAALGTPIDVVNYDVYPGAEGTATTTGSVASAVNQARLDYLSTSPRVPSVICIASGTTSPDDSATLEYYINAAVSSGITVVVSAGNLGVDASSYIPAAYGTKSGVICAGASDESNSRLASSNYGSPVDLYAPGKDVRTLRYSNPKAGTYDLMSGTSPAAAMVTAAALIQLSKYPTLTPAQVEQALVSTSYSTSVSASLVQVEPPAASGDADEDGFTNLVEDFFGSSTTDAASTPEPVRISCSAGEAKLSFKISSAHFDPANPYVLTDGATWKVKVSSDLADWQDATGTLTPGAAADGLIPMSFTLPVTTGAAFMRIEVTEAPVTE